MESSFKAKGSFGIPEGVQKQIEEARMRAAAKEAAESQPVEERAAPQVPQKQAAASEEEVEPAAADKDKKDELKERRAKEREQMLEIKEVYETNLGSKIEEEDVRDYIFKGRIVKEISIVPGYMKGRLQTLTVKESTAIDERMAKMQVEMKLTPQGYDNERAILILSQSWLLAQNKSDMRSLGTTPEEREETIRNMGAHVVDQANEASNQINWLLKFAMREKGFLKKS